MHFLSRYIMYNTPADSCPFVGAMQIKTLAADTYCAVPFRLPFGLLPVDLPLLAPRTDRRLEKKSLKRDRSEGAQAQMSARWISATEAINALAPYP